jgi:hypothetical protein
MRAKRIASLLTGATFAGVFITVGCLLYRQVIEGSDYRAERFGFPYYWMEHVTVAFSGRTDYWNISIANLVMNVVLFFMVGIAALCLILILKSKRN